MGYSMSRFEMDSELCDGGKGNDGVSATQTPNESFAHPNHEIAHLTNLRSCPSEHLSRVLPGRREINVSTVKMLAGREGNYSGRGRFSSSDCCHIVSKYLPVHGPLRVDKMNTRAYVSQFSDDGSLFVAGFQGSHIRIYDVDRGWKVHKDILAKNLRWTITDSSLSPDRCYLAYASMSPIVHIVNAQSAATESIMNITEIHEGLDFSDEDDGEYSFGIFSVKFSTDGRELVAGTNNKSIYVYDIGANKLTLRIPAHASDVNSVCFADETGHLIYSGSDDNLCKVWDRRCFNGRGQPAGVLSGHLEGITFVNTRGDGRYFISNGKDQTIKLWDIRRMSSKATICGSRLKNFEWDYRWMAFPVQAREWKHPNDQSLATYRGHAVLRTLIRCYFSPAYSTGQKYIYTGSNDGCVYIYDLVSGAQIARPSHHRMTVRDCSWHPFNPVLVSSSWDGSIVKWEFPGKEEPPSPLGRKKSRR